MKPQIPFLLFVCFTVSLFTGCVTRGPRYQVSIGNEDPALSLRDVEVIGDGRTLQTFSAIGPSKSAALRPGNGAPPLNLVVRWTDPKGVRHESDFNPREDMPVNFEGMIFVKITSAQKAELLRIAATSDDDSILPWNVPENWEGSIGIPGMGEL